MTPGTCRDGLVFGAVVADISRTRTIAAAPQVIWDVLADFGALSAWADGVDHSSVLRHGAPIGLARRVQVGRITLIETITTFDPPTELAYDITGLPRRFGQVSNRWTLVPADHAATTVTLTSTVDIDTGRIARVAERVISRLLANQSATLLADLAKRVERQHV
ncbi:SRPBCC family protein [soil metagenome]